MENSFSPLIRPIIAMLPERIASAVCRADTGAPVEELRLRIAQPPQMVFSSGEMLLEGVVFTRENAAELLEKLCRHSIYSHSEELKRGFLAFDGGIRIGVCGRPVSENGSIVKLTEVSSFNIRFAREALGCAEGSMRLVSEAGRPVSSLIIAAPSGGKTTLLRDIARCFSEGIGVDPVKTAIADERGELAGCSGGAPTFNVGRRTDVMEFVSKAEAVSLLVRSMSPEVIITDEIGDRADADSLTEAVRCGVAVIASAHASSAEELMQREVLSGLIKSGAFRRVLLLKRRGSVLRISPLKL